MLNYLFFTYDDNSDDSSRSSSRTTITPTTTTTTTTNHKNNNINCYMPLKLIHFIISKIIKIILDIKFILSY